MKKEQIDILQQGVPAWNAWRMKYPRTMIDLSEADLRGADLTGVRLAGSFLFRADFSGATLTGAKLSGAYLAEADLSRTDLSGADLSGAYLSGTKLSGANLTGTKLSEADLSRPDLRWQVERIRPTERVPEKFQDLWGGEFGCPCFNLTGELVGFVEFLPRDEVEFDQALETFKAV